MASLECGNCRCVFRDVVRVRKCPLCGNMKFSEVEHLVGLKQFPKWFVREGTVGFFYQNTMRLDSAAEA